MFFIATIKFWVINLYGVSFDIIGIMLKDKNNSMEFDCYII